MNNPYQTPNSSLALEEKNGIRVVDYLKFKVLVVLHLLIIMVVIYLALKFTLVFLVLSLFSSIRLFTYTLNILTIRKMIRMNVEFI